MEKKNDDDLPSVTSFFSRRAKLVAKVPPEVIKAATEKLTEEEKGKLGGNIKVSADEDKIILPDLRPIPSSSKGKRLKKSAGTKDLEKKDGMYEKINFDPDSVKLSAAAKRRLKKRKEEMDSELRIIDEENKWLLSTNFTEEVVNEAQEINVDDFEKLFVVSVNYLSKIIRLTCYENDKFSALLPRIADQFNMKCSEMLLSYKDHIITVNDTPKSLNLGVTDVLDCLPYKSHGNCSSDLHYEPNNLRIFFQSNDSKQKIDLIVHKLEKMQDIMEKYSQKRKIPLNLLDFEFDGEKMTGSETPIDLEMESNSTMDVRVLDTVKKPEVSTVQVLSDNVNPEIPIVDDLDDEENPEIPIVHVLDDEEDPEVSIVHVLDDEENGKASVKHIPKKRAAKTPKAKKTMKRK